MTVPVALLLYALAVSLAAPPVLLGSPILLRRARLGLIAWQATLVAVVGALALLAVSAAVPTDRLSFDLGHLLHACALVLTNRAGAAELSSAPLVSAALAAVFVLRLVWVFQSHVRALRQKRSRQRLLLDILVGSTDGDGVHELRSDIPVAYCVPGGEGRIVMTSGAKAALSPDERAAVIAHERAHLSGHHDLVLLGADVAARAFGFLPFFRTAQDQLRGLVEMAADDEAASRAGAIPLARALVGLGSGPTPHGSLGAADHMTAERVQRLLDDTLPTRSRTTAIITASAAAVVLMPWLIALAPAWAASHGLCLIP
ncbi:MAG: M56 family metallopeptidase [Actinobacteria bacterium]|nr:M56 family metallopeptidase [Actinomycetota bacterium]